MNPLLTPRLSRLLAIALLVLVIAVPYLGIVRPYVETLREGRETLAESLCASCSHPCRGPVRCLLSCLHC